MPFANFQKGPNDSAPKPSPVIPEPPREGGKVTQFIDISRYQEVLHTDAALKAGFEAVVAKCVDGDSGVDPMFKSHASAAKRAGMPFGAYCFNRFSADPIKQAEHFVKTVGSETRWLIADIEFDKSKATLAKFGDKYTKHMDDFAADHAEKFLRKVFQLTGVKPWIYLNGYHFVGFKNPERFLEYPCWISNYIQKRKDWKDLDLNLVHLPAPYKKQHVVAWQWTDAHKAGQAICKSDGLDANLFYGSVSDLKRLAAQ